MRRRGGRTINGQETTSESPAKADAPVGARRSRWSARIAWAALAVVTLSVVVWSVTFFMEVAEDMRQSSGLSRGPSADGSGDVLLKSAGGSDAKYQVPPDSLPLALDGWVVQGVQPVPGSDGTVVEGNYTPRDDERSVVMPLVVYVQTTRIDKSRAQSVADRALTSRYTDAHATYVVQGVKVRSGRTPDGGSYFVTWERGGMVYGVDATFRYRIPASGGRSVIKSAADEIARAVIMHRPGQGGVQ